MPISTNRYQLYLGKLKENYKPAVKIEWLNADDTVQTEITNYYIDMSGTLSVNMKNGCRRTCDISLDNSNGQFNITAENLWYGRKIRLWTGVYLDDGTPYYVPQGIFYITSVNEIRDPGKRTITIQCTDKWAFLDGSLWGYLDGKLS